MKGQPQEQFTLDFFLEEYLSVFTEVNYVVGMSDLDKIRYTNFLLGLAIYFD